MNRKILHVVFGFLFAVLGTAADRLAAEPLKVGAILPLSGTVAPWGQRLRVGLETANELHAKQFTFTYEDEGACEAQKALTAYRKLVNLDGVKIIFPGCPGLLIDPHITRSTEMLEENRLVNRSVRPGRQLD